MHEILPLVAQYGLALVFVNVLAEQAGLPVPAIPTLIIAGALVADGKLSLLAIFSAAFVAGVGADLIWFVAGRLYGSRILRLLCRISLSPDSCVRLAGQGFERWGGLTLLLGKFIPGVATIAPPLAGAMRLSWRSFLVLDGLGVTVWAGAAIGAGMMLHAQIDRFLLALEDFGLIAIEAICVLLAGYIAIKWWERRRFYKMLRVARITVDELRRLTNAGKTPVVVDLRSSALRKSDPRFIPGALAMDIEEVDKRLEELPTDRDVIFYCTCPNEASAAYVAKQLIDRGYTRVRPLEGGLDAWIAAGYDLEHRSPTIPVD